MPGGQKKQIFIAKELRFHWRKFLRPINYYHKFLQLFDPRHANEGDIHVYHIFSLFDSNRDALQQHLGALGIQTGKHYPIPIHLQEAYAHLGHKAGHFPVSERIADTQLSLPIYPEMSEPDIARVVEGIMTRPGRNGGA